MTSEASIFLVPRKMSRGMLAPVGNMPENTFEQERSLTAKLN